MRNANAPNERPGATGGASLARAGDGGIGAGRSERKVLALPCRTANAGAATRRTARLRTRRVSGRAQPVAPASPRCRAARCRSGRLRRAPWQGVLCGFCGCRLTKHKAVIPTSFVHVVRTRARTRT